MGSRYFSSQCIFSCLIACFSTLHATSITWVAQSPNNDINNSANWSPNTIPGSSDSAIFDSSISGISTNPVENSVPFSVSTFNFPSVASLFTFNFTNASLSFSGSGITGSSLNPTVTVTNTNNLSFPGDLISFNGGTGNCGSSMITSANSGLLTGTQSGVSMGAFNSHLHSTGAFTIGNSGTITATNTGNDSAIGLGNNGVANTGSSQLAFDQSFTAGNNVAILITNSGTFSGANTAQGDVVAIVNGSQLISSGAFLVGDNFSCGLQNTGNDSSTGVGLSDIGQLNAAQMLLQTTGTIGNNCTITISNTGINSSQATSSPDFIGYLTDEQFFVGGSFQAGDNFSLTTKNTGSDSSSGYGSHQVAVINSNSGTTGNQILFQQGATLGGYATISASNTGTYTGTNTNGGSNVAGMNLEQIAIGDRTAPGSYAFSSGDYFSLNVANSGFDSSHGTGGNAVGDVSTDQITFFTPVNLGNYATIAISNSGNFSGNASSSYVNIGSAGSSQLNYTSSLSAQDNFTLSISNSGTNAGTGVGGYFIGDLINGQQLVFQNSFVLGNNGSITISNRGSNSSNTISNNQVGSFMGYGKQLLAKSLFQVGNGFVLKITNSGFDDSTGSGGNFVGFMNNNTGDNSASQLHLANGGTLGDRASFTLSNTGTYQGSNTTSSIAALAGQQFYSVGDFHAGSNFVFTVSNSGIDSALGQNNHHIGTVGSSQIQFDGACVLGKNVSLSLSNSGTNKDSTGTLNNIGVINGSQLAVNGNFTAGNNLSLSVSNTSVNEGNSNNVVGSVTGSQIAFSEKCTLNNGSSISAFNSGSVGVSQILFEQGFTVASGRVAIQAVNQGAVGGFGIDVQGSSSGGNACITLGSCLLNIETTLSTFTIGGLAGDGSSIVLSQPQLMINTDAAVQSDFSGVIQNFSSLNSPLIKNGAGEQILSGSNTYTGLTSVLGGILSVNGSIVGDVMIESGGTLTGSGTIGGSATINSGGTLTGSGTIGGNVTIHSGGILTGSGTIGGNVAIDSGGILKGARTIGGNLGVSSGGVLKGTGTVKGTATIANGGTLSPGNSIGTIHFGGLILNPSAKTVIEIDPNASSSVAVVGNALIDGPLQIVQDHGLYHRQGSYQIVSAGSLSGVFSSVNTFPGFTFNLTYPGDGVYLNYILAVPTQGLSGNSLKVASYLNDNADSSYPFMFLAALSGDELNQALKSISPARNAFGNYIGAQTAFSLSNLVSNHMDQLRVFRAEALEGKVLSALTADKSDRISPSVRSQGPKNKFSAWISGFGEVSHQASSLQNPSFKFISKAVLAGLDYEAENRGVAGGALGYAHTHYHEDHHAGHGDMNYYFASLYGNGFVGDVYFSPAIWGIFNQANNVRNMSYPGFSEKARAEIFAWQCIPHLEVGYDAQFSWGDILPFTSADWAISFQRGYREHGASPFNARQKDHNSSMLRSETGFKFCETWEKTWGTFSLREKISYVFEKPFGTGTVNAAFVGVPGFFTVTAVNQNLNLGAVGANFLVAIGKVAPVKLDFGYEGEFGSHYSSNELMFTISKGF